MVLNDLNHNSLGSGRRSSAGDEHGDGLAEGRGPPRFAGSACLAGDGDLGRRGKEAAGVLLPESKELGLGPIASIVVAPPAVEVALIAEFKACQGRSGVLICISECFGSEGEAGCAGCRFAEIGAAEILAGRRGDEGSSCGDVNGADLI